MKKSPVEIGRWLDQVFSIDCGAAKPLLWLHLKYVGVPAFMTLTQVAGISVVAYSPYILNVLNEKKMPSTVTYYYPTK